LKVGWMPEILALCQPEHRRPRVDNPGGRAFGSGFINGAFTFQIKIV